MPINEQGDTGDNDCNTRSILFSRQLHVIPSKPNDILKQRSATSAALDIRELGLKVDQARKKPRIETNESRNALIFNHDKADRAVGKSDTIIFKDLAKIRENSTKLKEYKNHKLSENIKRPNDIDLGSTDSFVSQLQNCVDKFRDKITHAIIRESDINLEKLKDKIGKIKNIQILNNSLKIIEVETSKLKTSKIGLVALFNEWVEIKIGDQILIQDIDFNNGDLQWCLNWKKIVKS